jgi:hypothetical protein
VLPCPGFLEAFSCDTMSQWPHGMIVRLVEPASHLMSVLLLLQWFRIKDGHVKHRLRRATICSCSLHACRRYGYHHHHHLENNQAMESIRSGPDDIEMRVCRSMLLFQAFVSIVSTNCSTSCMRVLPSCFRVFVGRPVCSVTPHRMHLPFGNMMLQGQ